jgi:biopolymer transport protein ExbB
MKQHTILAAVILAAICNPAVAQQESSASERLAQASEESKYRLEQALAELAALRERVATEKLPLAKRLGELEAARRAAQAEFNSTKAVLDGSVLNLSTLEAEIKARKGEVSYLSNLMGDYVREFEPRLHIAELQHYRDNLEEARLAPSDENLSDNQIFEKQAALLDLSIDRLEKVVGGYRFEGQAVDSGSLIQKGQFAMLGPVALFRADNGLAVGLAEERVGGSLEANAIPLPSPEDRAAAEALVGGSGTLFPLDTTMGTAFKVADTEKTTWQEIQEGGTVMVPIFAMAAVSLLIAVLKWLSLMFVRSPSKRKINALLEAVRRDRKKEALQIADTIAGPTGTMLAAGSEHLGEPSELIEEIMYETVLTTRLKVERFIPFVAISAASAPLLGLLGTVSGIINTFKMITISGAGDVKSLSGGISEALITTKYGLIVAIPSLLMHAFLSRKARGVIAQMEKAAVAFVNQVSMTPSGRNGLVQAPIMSPVRGVTADENAVRRQVNDILRDMLGPVFDGSTKQPAPQSPVQPVSTGADTE